MQESRLFRIYRDVDAISSAGIPIYVFGNKVTIIRPKSIRQTLKTKHEKARDHHKGE